MRVELQIQPSHPERCDYTKGATWLGNDQSHYFKLFEEYDITTLKELIGLIVSELDTAYRKKKYIEAIQGRK